MSEISSKMQMLCDKIDLLLLNIDFIQYGKASKRACAMIIEKYLAKKKSFNLKLMTIQQLLKRYKANYEDSQEMLEKIKYQIVNFNKIEVILTKNPNNSDSDFAKEKCDSQNYYEMSPHLEVLRKSASTKVTPNYLTFDVVPLSVEEYELIPKYMLCRLSLESINNFIDVVNRALLYKYNLLSKSARSLKNSELQLYKQFKLEQSGILKVKRFVKEGDIAREYNKPTLEKKCHNFLVILRHCKRISRVNESSTIYYPPFESNTYDETYKKISKALVTFPEHVSEGARNLIKNILVVDPNERLDLGGILNHSWILNFKAESD